MEFTEKARIRLEHWIEHNHHHHEEYSEFADQLDEAGKTESAQQIRKMSALSKEATACLKKALEAID